MTILGAMPAVSAPPLDPQQPTRPDPALITGELVNGMRYSIKEVSSADRGISIRLRVPVGVRNEGVGQNGAAEAVGQIVMQHTRRNDSAVGSVTTTFTETVFQWDLDSDSKAAVVLNLVRSALTHGASNATEQEIESTRTSAGKLSTQATLQRLQQEQTAFLLPTPNRVQARSVLDADAVDRFYSDHYDPSGCLLVVVGEVEPRELQKVIEDNLGKLPTKARFIPAAVQLPKRGLEILQEVTPSAPPWVTMSWVTAFDSSADTLDRERRDILELISLLALSSRIQRSLETEGLLGPISVSRKNVAGTVKATTIEFHPLQLNPKGLQVIDRVRQDALSTGLSDQEISEVARAMSQQFTAAADGGIQRTEKSIADDIVASFDEGDVYVNDQQAAVIVGEALRSINRDKVNDALRNAFVGEGPLVFIATPTPVAGGKDAVSAALRPGRSPR